MPRLAKVIVDVPTMQTDKPYTYRVPKLLASQIKPGMRIRVPFGWRRVQGFVIKLINCSYQQLQQIPYRLKYIASIMDLVPAVTPELLALSKWLAQDTFSFRINCLMTMLPAAMKARYQKRAVMIAPPDRTMRKLFKNQRSLSVSKRLTNRQAHLLISLRRQNRIKIEYLVHNQAKAAKMIGIQSRLVPQQIKHIASGLSKRNVGQLHLLRFLFHHPKYKYPERNIIKAVPHVSSGTLKTASRKHWISRFTMTRYRNPYQRKVKPTRPFRLNADQQKVVQPINRSITANHYLVYLIEGVTGSGKTEVYLHVMQNALKQGKTALMLVPEISLTPQMVRWVKSRFGNRVAILHSGLSDGEKYDEWQRIRNGEAPVVIGARSAIFAPLRHLGVIIMDEEHDSSYKQENTPRYQTHDVARWRGKYNHCPVILGSATPSLASRARAMKGRYQLLSLPHRINHHPLPKTHVIDMRKDFAENHRISNFSIPLIKAIRQRIKRHEQTVLMLNRRGYSSFIMCRNCGYVPKCPNCDVSLTFHYYSRSLRCHYCGYSEPVPMRCPKCHSRQLSFNGTGTEQAERELQHLIPQARIVRMDVDTTSRKGAHERLLHRFGSGKANILLGTQMIAKGLDFPNVTLVGVLDADVMLHMPDYQAPEKTFQLLTQVSGRAGRADKPGEVYIQTFQPRNRVIQLAKTQDYERFFTTEMQKRYQHNFPPYYYLVRITSASIQKQNARASIYQIRDYLSQQLDTRPGHTILTAPAPAPIDKLKRRYYFQLTIRYKFEPRLVPTLNTILNKYQSQTKHGIFISIDPSPDN